MTLGRREGAELLEDLFRRSNAYRSSEAYLEAIRSITRFNSQGRPIA